MIGLDQILNKCSDGITAGCTIAWHHVGYVIHYKENIQKLQDETKKLENELTRIDGTVERAKNNGEIPEANVLQWIESAKGIKGDVEAFLVVDGARENKWCFKWCPNVYRRYKLGKGSEEKIARAISIKEEGEKYLTLEVAHPKPPLKFVYNFSQGYEAFDSRAEIFENIMKALADPCFKIIGLYGPGGVGKTTMAKEVGKLAKQNGLFDDVAMATLSLVLNEKAVKEKLALELGLKLDGSAHQLYHRLNNGKRNLVILDDVWEPLNLANIEIPITDGNKGCKVVIASRKRHLCRMMSVPVDQEDSLNEVLAKPKEWTKEFLIGVLQKPEAWALFKKVAAISMDSEIPSEAKEVCDKCGGLPVAIRAVAVALKGKGKHAWKDALRQLKNYKIKKIADIDQKLLISLKWSYDRLEPKDARSCFLLCSLFPEDAEISIDDLVRYSIGMRLLDFALNTFDDVTNRVLAMVEVLKISCLLLDDTDESVVKMHDIIRDVARSIAEDEKRYLVKHGIEKWPVKGRYEHYSTISLRFTANIHKFPIELQCRGLHTLVLACGNDSPTDFPNNFFNGMENNLEVLDLSEMPIKSLPSSLSTLVKLRMLCLNGGRLMTEIALLEILGSLRNLEILSLTGMEKVLSHSEDGTGFSELQFSKSQPQIPPGSFCNLCELRVENCQFKFLFTHSIARGLVQLQRLEIGDSKDMEEIIRNERQGDEEEIIFHHLKKMVLKRLPNLRSFYSSMKNTSITEANNSNPLLPLFCEKVAFPALEGLTIEFLGNISGIIGDKQLKLPVQQEENESFWNLPCLRDLRIVYCSKLKAIVVANKEGRAHGKPLIFRDLHSLYLSNLDNLKSFYSICGSKAEEEISKPQPLFNEKVAFPALEGLTIELVENISGIIGDKQLKLPVQQEENESFWNLPRLRDLRIVYCSKLKAIVVANKEGGTYDKPLIFRDLRSLYLSNLDNLKSFYSICGSKAEEEISKPQLLFNEKVAFPALEDLGIFYVRKISGIIGDKQLKLPVQQEVNESLWNLPRLRHLSVRTCSKLKAIVVANKEGGAHDMPFIFRDLHSLYLSNLDNLKSFYSICGSKAEEEIFKPQPLFNEKVAFPALEYLDIGNVNNISGIIDDKQLKLSVQQEENESFWQLRNLPRLRDIRISGCFELKAIVVANKDGGAHDKPLIFRELRSLYLSGLQNLKSFYSICRSKVEEEIPEPQPLFNEKVSFSALEELQLKDLPTLTHLWKGPTTQLVWLCNLTSLQLNRCDKLESMFSLCIARDLMQLQILSVSECRKIEVLISSEKEGDQNEIASTTKETIDKIVFPKLKELCLGGLPSLTAICKVMNGIELLQLNKLILWEMPKLNSFCNTSDSNYDTIQPLFNKVIFPALEELRIDRLPKITEIWYRKLSPSEYFRQLRYMTIRNCQELKVMVLENGEEEVKVENNNNTFSFPELMSLTLENLQSLESFCTSRSKAQSLFTSQVPFPALEELLISGVPNITEIWGKQFPSELKVNCFEKLMNAVQSNMLPRLRNLRKLLENAKKKAMAQENKRNDDVIVFPRLKTVRLDNLQNLEIFCRTRRVETQTLFNHQIDCPELRVLAIGWVPNITDVWDKKLLPTGSFCQLRELRIEGCDKLVNVILSNMLPRLQSLTELSVQYCPMVEEILSEKGEEKADAEAKKNILFPQLKTLELGSLESLKSFCASRLAAQHFFKYPVAFASLKELHIRNLPNITEIWGKQLLPVPKIDAQSFEKLAVVNVTWCEKLVNVIPSSMFPRLNNLKSIYVKGCPEMEMIVSKKANATVNGNIISFPRLRSLSIDKLYNLKSFCSSSTSEEAQPLFDDQVVFPILEDLFINRVQNITKIWDKLHSRESFCLLKRMMIVDCEKLVNVVPSFMLPQLQNLEVLNAYSCQKMLAIVSKEEGKEKDDENTILFPKLTTSNLKSLDNLTTFYTQPFLNCQVYGGELMASPTEAKMYHHTKLNVEPKPEVLSSAPAKLDESNDHESKDSQHSDDNNGISGDTMDLNDAGHDINTSFNTPNAERGIIIAQPSESDIMDVLIKENQKTWGLVRQWEAKYKQLEESWELRARVIAALEAKLFDQSGPSNMDMDIKNCMEWKDTEIQRLTKLVINLECEKTIVQDLFDDQSIHIITQVEAQKAHDSLKKHPIAALEHIIRPPSRVKRIKQKVRKEHRLDEFEYPNLPGQKKGKEGAEEQSHIVQIAQDLDKHLQKKHPTKYEKLTLNNKLKVWANMSKLNKQKVQNLHKNGGDELLVWRGDLKIKDVYFDDIICIIKEESITNNVIDAYGEILLELQGLVNPSLDDSAFIFTSTCLKIMQEYPPHKRNKLIDVHIKEYQDQRFLIFPIHDNFHWTIVVYDVKDNVWRHYNSLRPRPSIHDPHIDKAQIVRDYIEAVVRNIGPSSPLWTKLSGQNTSQPIISVDICPQQASDSVDCGPAVCYIMRAHVYREEIVDSLTRFEWCQLRDSLVHLFLNHRKTVQCKNL